LVRCYRRGDFQARLTEELGDKSMFEPLESPALLDSRWVRYEIAKATAVGIGRYALHIPGGGIAEQINEEARYRLKDADFVAGRYAPDHALTDEALENETRLVLHEHIRALLWRRASLQNSMLAALSAFGVRRSEFDDSAHFTCFEIILHRPQRRPAAGERGRDRPHDG
jgi:hypothetical protein